MSSELFSERWLVSCNEALASQSPNVPAGTKLAVTELVTGAPAGRYDAVSLVADGDGVRLVAGEAPGSTAWLTVAFEDAEALHEGRLTPAAALTEGRLHVRGDLRAVVDAVALLADAHAAMRARG